MKPLNKNLAYDCSNLSEEEMRELSKHARCRMSYLLRYKSRKLYFNKSYNEWMMSTILDITNFTDAKTLFND